MTILEKTFGQITIFEKNIRSNDHFWKTFGQMTIFRKKQSNKWTFGQMNIFRKKNSVTWTFGQMTIFLKSFRTNGLSVICYFGHLTSFSSKIFGQMIFFDKMNFLSNGLRLNGAAIRANGVSVKWCFGQMAFRLKIFGE
jgi:hypothetical protein